MKHYNFSVLSQTVTDLHQYQNGNFHRRHGRTIWDESTRILQRSLVSSGGNQGQKRRQSHPSHNMRDEIKNV